MYEKKSDEITLLMVEDDKFNRLLVVSMLAKNKKIKVLEAGDGQEALKLLKSEEIDILLLDINMPKMNGLETLKWIRHVDRFEKMPVLVISSDDMEKRGSLALGATAFISKPYNIKNLEQQIYALLEMEI